MSTTHVRRIETATTASAVAPADVRAKQARKAVRAARQKEAQCQYIGWIGRFMIWAMRNAR